jgi:hypothetical protein
MFYVILSSNVYVILTCIKCAGILHISKQHARKEDMPEVFQPEEPLSLEKLEYPGWSWI